MVTKYKIAGRQTTKNKVVRNLLRYYNLATQKEIEDGKRWYTEANQFCQELANQYGLTVYKVAGIVSAFSPQCEWGTNKKIATEFIRNRGRAFIANRDRTIKAKKIYKAEHPDHVYEHLSMTKNGSKKTKAFYRNIVLPEFCDTTVVDRHMIAASIQRPDKTQALDEKQTRITPKQYDFLSDCMVTAARKVKLIPSQLQSIVWVVYRRCRGLSKPEELPVIDGYVPMEEEPF